MNPSQPNISLSKEVKRRQKIADALEQILTASAISKSQSFFASTLASLAKTYETKFAFIGEFADQTKTRIRTRCVVVDGLQVDNFEYSLRGTPCEDVLNLDLELIPENAAQLYPDDQLLVDMGIESYFGSPLIADTGEMMGLVSVMDAKPLQIDTWSRPILGIMSHILAREVVRIHQQEQIELSATVFHETAEAIQIADENGAIVSCNAAALKLTGHQACDLCGQQIRVLQDCDDPDFDMLEFNREIDKSNVWQGEVWEHHAHGHTIPTWQTVTVVRDSDQRIKQYIAIFSDISEKKQAEQEIFQLAHFDQLTQLPNRTAFSEHLDDALNQSRRNGSKLALLFVDLDNFKRINDSAGHQAGDQFLIDVSQRLQSVTRKDDMLARFGGDEFIVLLQDVNEAQHAAIAASKIIDVIKQPFRFHNTHYETSASVGICLFPGDAYTSADLIKQADMAMYEAKTQGRNRYTFYTQDLSARVIERQQMEVDLKDALMNRHFDVYYQPKLNTLTGIVTGCEALIRWRHKEKGFIPPDTFISLAEEVGLIGDIGRYVCEKVFNQLLIWQKGLNHSFPISINLSAIQMQDHGFLEFLKDRCIDAPDLANQIEFELTETVLVDNIEDTLHFLQQLKQLGFGLSVDDFGTGYSSMAYLKRLPLDKIKIDRTFISDINKDDDDYAIVKATISMGHNLGLQLIAEGVETHEQLEVLKHLKCDEVQGYLYSKPLPPETLVEWLLEHQAGKSA